MQTYQDFIRYNTELIVSALGGMAALQLNDVSHRYPSTPEDVLQHITLTINPGELIFHTLERITAEGKAVIVSTHDLGVLTVHFTRALFLDKRIIADGPPKEVLTPETIAEAYGFEFHKDYHPWNS